MSEPEKRRFQMEPGFKLRVLEVMLTTIISSTSAAIAVTWSMSALVTQVRQRLDRLEAQVQNIESTVVANAQLDNTQQIELAVDNSQNGDIVRRLNSIENKIDRLGR